MDKELKAKWVEALRSGKYEQATGSLIDRIGPSRAFCCLGVLCEVSGTEWTGRNDSGLLDGFEVRDVGRSYLSQAALQKFGLDDSQQQALAGMNDNGEPFSKIADYIEHEIL